MNKKLPKHLGMTYREFKVGTIKKTIYMITLILLSGCAHLGDWKVNGIPLSRFKDAGPKEYSQLAGGVGLSFLAHWAGHVVCLESQGAEWHQDGLSEVYTAKDLTESENRWVGRSGFVAKLLVGTGLKHTKWADSWWVTGYQIGTVAEITTYPVLFNGDGDLYTIRNHGGNADLEYLFYSGWALWNLGPY
jgi:hypothetical protein